MPFTAISQDLTEKEEIQSHDQHPYSLNVRLSSHVIHPPKKLVKHVVTLNGIRAARPRVGPPPQSAILEDDQRQRVVILSTDDTGIITAYVMNDLDLKPHLPKVMDCTQQHHCAEDRMAVTGGLACVAICLKNVLDKLMLPFLNRETMKLFKKAARSRFGGAQQGRRRLGSVQQARQRAENAAGFRRKNGQTLP